MKKRGDDKVDTNGERDGPRSRSKQTQYMKGQVLHETLTRQQMKYGRIDPPRSQSVMNDKRTYSKLDQVKRQNAKYNFLEAQGALKCNKITLHDVMKYYCDY